MSQKLLCAVQQDKEKVILSCKVVESINTKTSATIESKTKIIENIQKTKDADEYFTALWNDKLNPGKYEKKAKVEAIDSKYLRSDGNKTKEDNLDNLPTF